MIAATLAVMASVAFASSAPSAPRGLSELVAYVNSKGTQSTIPAGVASMLGFTGARNARKLEIDPEEDQDERRTIYVVVDEIGAPQELILATTAHSKVSPDYEGFMIRADLRGRYVAGFALKGPPDALKFERESGGKAARRRLAKSIRSFIDDLIGPEFQ